MTYGLTPEGFNAKPVEQLQSEIETAQRATVSTTLDTSAEALVGEMNASVITQLRQLWELLGIVYAARDPRQASYSALDAVCAITGTTRKAATKGLVTLQVSLAAGVTLTAGHVARVGAQPTNRWVTTEVAVNPGGATAWIDVQAQAEATGKIVANAGTIDTIATPATGWLAVRNPLDASVGAEAENDPPLRLRRELELSRSGTATIPAVTADLAALSVVASVIVEENTSAFYDRFRRPPHCIEAVVQFTPGLSGAPLDAARQTLAGQLWQSKGDGIDTYGDHSATVVDTNSQSHTMRWSEPAAVTIYVSTLLRIDPSAYVGDTAVRAAVAAFGDTLKMGDDVIRSKLICLLIDLPGVVDVLTLSLGRDAFSLREANVTIDRREVAVFDTSRVTVATE